MDTSLLREFRLDWQLTGKAPRTACDYIASVEKLLEQHIDLSLADVKKWIASTSSVTTRRKRGQAVRAVGKWAEEQQYKVMSWWRHVPLVKETSRPQTTATEIDYRKALSVANTIRDVSLIEVLWSTGLCLSEIERLNVADVNPAESFILVTTQKTGKAQVVPLSLQVLRALRRLLRGRDSGSVFGMSPCVAIRLRLQHMGIVSAHAWRRGWAVRALRSVVSEASVKAAVGWSGGAMVSCYTTALTAVLAIKEFHKR